VFATDTTHGWAGGWGGTQRFLTETWNGSAFEDTPEASLIGNDGDAVRGIWAASAGSVWEGGYLSRSFQKQIVERPVMLRYDGSAWTEKVLPNHGL
jgi:hypothetical protein